MLIRKLKIRFYETKSELNYVVTSGFYLWGGMLNLALDLSNNINDIGRDSATIAFGAARFQLSFGLSCGKLRRFYCKDSLHARQVMAGEGADEHIGSGLFRNCELDLDGLARPGLAGVGDNFVFAVLRDVFGGS